MPIYEYECEKCCKTFEEIVSFSDTGEHPCPACGAKETKRVLSACVSRTAGDGGGSSCGTGASAGFS